MNEKSEKLLFVDLILSEEILSIFNLQDRQKQILIKRYKHNYTLHEIAEEWALSRERVRQLYEKSILSITLKIIHRTEPVSSHKNSARLVEATNEQVR